MYFPEYSKTSIDQWLMLNDTIVLLDPLKFDERMSLLHDLNRAGDTRAIVQMLYDMLPLPDTLDQFTYEEAIATMRDLGIFVGILKKHGVEPVEAVPELEFVLLVLMVKTALPPRDTLIHYTLCNPVGPRMRTYTGLPDERALIESVKMAMPDLWRAIVQLEELHSAELSGHEFVTSCFSLRDKMNAMVKGVVHAKRNVNPAVFANDLRFYYDPIKVDYSKDYIGPGAVEMPMFVFDHLLWSCDCTDHVYTAFKEGYLPYNLSFVREIYWNFKNRPSLITRVVENLDSDPTPENYLAANAVLELCTVLKSFRMPHKKLAEEAYAHNSENNRQHGSGGYSTDILTHIITLQTEKIEELKTSIAYARVKAER